MKKIHCTFNLSEDVFEHRKKNPVINSFGDWIDKKYREEFMNLETEKEKLRLMREALVLQENLVSELSGKEPEESLIGESAMKWLKEEGLDRIEKFSIEGVLKYFNNEFGLDLTLRQFRIYVEEAKK